MFDTLDQIVIGACLSVTALLMGVMLGLGLADSVNTWQHPNDPSTDNYRQPISTCL